MANKKYEPSEERQLLADHITEEDVQKLADAREQGKEAFRAELKKLREHFAEIKKGG